MSRQFSAFRGLAILLVVINHAVTLSFLAVMEHGYPASSDAVRVVLVSLKTLGVIAVPIFLFLSGGYLAYALQAGRSGQAYRTVLLGLRFIIVPYLLWSLIFYGLLYLLDGRLLTPTEALKQLIVGYPYNFIPLLVFFYLLAPLLLPIARRLPWLLLAGLAAYQLYSIAVLQPGSLGFSLPEWASGFTLPVLRLTIALWGIFFPLGLVFGVHALLLTPRLRQLRWPLVAGAVVTYLAAVLNELSMLRFPLAELLCPVFAVLLMPVVTREAIPWFRQVERLGKRAYGIYLTNLIFLSLALEAAVRWAPWLFQWLWLLVPVLIATAIAGEALLQAGLARISGRSVQRWVFG